jgi:hypothetical protein
LKVA